MAGLACANIKVRRRFRVAPDFFYFRQVACFCAYRDNFWICLDVKHLIPCRYLIFIIQR
jgi:hypothetical protein